MWGTDVKQRLTHEEEAARDRSKAVKKGCSFCFVCKKSQVLSLASLSSRVRKGKRATGHQNTGRPLPIIVASTELVALRV